MEKDELTRPTTRLVKLAASSGAYTSCQHVGDETINGEAAAIYTEVNKKSGIFRQGVDFKKRGPPR